MSSVDFEEAGHKLLKIKLEPGQLMELCIMLLECCSQERTYLRYYEEDTTSSSRIFIKILFQELSEHLGIRRLNERLSDPTMMDSFESIFPRDNPKNTRFSINFFTSIGLGGITENLREYLKNMPRLIMQQQEPASGSESGDESGSSSSSDSGSASSESESETIIKF
ncbi:late embryoproteinsis abundant hydroxyproline-rich glycoprotein [Hibiscus syriacus]|uniref:Late embryoproteinsis abundant hydroxyproline-rich glycoprotein n=1 Tax=Hibiscus syriacus TaxID=106335 RepID=A0A6A2Z2I0_HIBSY|nr:late embryoproteinsis abundant hydroxyproline-rich glycoprotein [Hibiscus syriacus]